MKRPLLFRELQKRSIWNVAKRYPYELRNRQTLVRHSSSGLAAWREVKIGDLNLDEICKSGNAPATFNFAKDIFDWHAEQRPYDCALWLCSENNEDRIWSFSQLKTESIRAALIIQNVVGPRTPAMHSPFVLTILPKVPEWWFLHMGAIRAGVVFCPGTTMLTADDIQYRVESSSASVIITDEENAEKVEKAQQRLKSSKPEIVKRLKKVMVCESGDKNQGDWLNYGNMSRRISDSDTFSFKHATTKSDDIAQAFFTSGTTGKPKMAAHSHVSYGIGHIETARQIGLRSTDVFWNLSDPGWAKSSYSNFFAPWLIGSTVFIHQMKRIEPKRVLEVLCTKPISVLCAPPTLYRSMVAESNELFKFNCLREALGAGEAVNPEVSRAWKEKTGNIPINQMYGQTEFTVLGCEVPDDRKQGSIGRPNGMYSVIVVDENGSEVPRGKEGIIALKTTPKHPIGLFKGYLKPGPNDDGPVWDDEKNRECFKNGLYLTGDTCIMDEDGFIFFLGRADDVINSSGYRIGPNEVESALQTHPAVLESAVVPSPDPQRGEVVKAFIILTEPYRESDKEKLKEEIQNHVKKQTAPYKYPRKVEFVESLPKTVSGKILRRELKQKEFANVNKMQNPKK